jgi:hypothetical protein
MKIYLDIATTLLSQDPPPRLDARGVGRIVPVVTAQRFSDGAQAGLVPNRPRLEA